MKTGYVVLILLLSAAAKFSVARSDEKTPDSQAEAKPAMVPTLDQARRQAEILHTAMHATLQVVHHRYYQEDEGLLLPAATLKEVFAELEKEEGVTLRWLAVEGQVMNTDHSARDEFEREAVKALKSGKLEYEQVENGTYRRAGPITLSNHCLKCHVPDRKSTEDRTAGLIISIPVK
ncbi:MAG: DUF3365 domain-containing protein [Planctomycetota bacterium]|nr:MAG: DUF3365 domain-containing protein [Planctomycetota bacterium]